MWAIGNSVPAGSCLVVSVGDGVVRLARAAGALQLCVAVGLAGHRGVGGLLHVEAELQPVLGFPGGVVGDHLDVLASVLVSVIDRRWRTAQPSQASITS